MFRLPQLNRFTMRRVALLALVGSTVLATGVAAALLNLTLSYPLIAFNNQGTTSYTAATDSFVVDASPLAIRLSPSEAPLIISGADEDFSIRIQVDQNGDLVGGVPGDDLLVSGDVTLPSGPVSGTLLTGEVTGFGFSDTGGPNDLFNFTFLVTGGLLADYYTTAAVELISEKSNFDGSFEKDFGGEAKGTLGGFDTALGDFVWEDCNGNGIQDEADCDNDPTTPPQPEPGIPNVTVRLLDPGTNGCGTGDEAELATTTTDADGLYLFPNLAYPLLEPGAYCVEFVKPAGFECTLDNQGTDNALDSDVVDQGDGTCQTVDPDQNPIDLEAGETDLTWDAGLIRPASLGDFVWDDDSVTRNDVQDAGEAGVENTVVTLLDCQGNPVTEDFYGNLIGSV